MNTKPSVTHRSIALGPVDEVRRPGRAKRYTNPLQGGYMRYRIAIHQSDEGYSVSVPGLPGCWSQGATDAEAVENIKDAIREYLAVVDEQLRGEEIREIDVAV
jgi:predicted RNase H-like HicB family nuclease